MIELKGSRFTQILPENLASQRETQALAYAIGRQVNKLLALSDRARPFAALETASEQLLDYLAVELRTPSYRQDYSVEVKRVLVQRTLIFYATMGTPGAVDEIIETIFGSGQIEEWFGYGGQPHHFRATIAAGGAIGAEELAEFRRVLASVKRLSSWLDSITTVTEIPGRPVRAGGALCGSVTDTTLPPVTPGMIAATYLAAAAWSVSQTELPSLS